MCFLNTLRILTDKCSKEPPPVSKTRILGAANWAGVKWDNHASHIRKKISAVAEPSADTLKAAGAATPGEVPRADCTPPARDATGADTPG